MITVIISSNRDCVISIKSNINWRAGIYLYSKTRSKNRLNMLYWTRDTVERPYVRYIVQSIKSNQISQIPNIWAIYLGIPSLKTIGSLTSHFIDKLRNQFLKRNTTGDEEVWIFQYYHNLPFLTATHRRS